MAPESVQASGAALVIATEVGSEQVRGPVSGLGSAQEMGSRWELHLGGGSELEWEETKVAVKGLAKAPMWESASVATLGPDWARATGLGMGPQWGPKMERG